MPAEGVHASVKAISDVEAACARFSAALLDHLPEIEREIMHVTEALEERRSELRREIENLNDTIVSADENDDISWEERRLDEARGDLSSVNRCKRRLEEAAGDYRPLAHNAEEIATLHALKMKEFLQRSAGELKRYFSATSNSPAFANSVFNSDAGKTLTPNSQLLMAQLSAQEDELAVRYGTEKMIVLNSDGAIVLDREGGKESVPILLHDEPLLLDAILTHNHPQGRSFSEGDLSTAASVNLKEIRAVGVALPYTYSLKRPLNGWPTRAEILHHRKIAAKQVLEDLVVRINRGELTQDEADQIFAHEIMLKLAASLNLPYERTKRNQSHGN